MLDTSKNSPLKDTNVRPGECAVEVDALMQGINRTLGGAERGQHSFACLCSHFQLTDGTTVCSQVILVLSVQTHHMPNTQKKQPKFSPLPYNNQQGYITVG